MLHSRGRRRLAGVVLVALAFGLIPATTAMAQQQGTFECRGTGLRVGSSEGAVANRPGTPCRTDDSTTLDQTVPLGSGNFVRVMLLESRTKANNVPGRGRGGGAQAGVAAVGIKLGGLTVTAGALRSRNYAYCNQYGPNAGPPTMQTAGQDSDVAVVFINGRKFAVSQPTTIPVPGVGTVYLNRTQRTQNGLTNRALEVDRPGTAQDIVIAESKVGYSGNPCRPA